MNRQFQKPVPRRTLLAAAFAVALSAAGPAGAAEAVSLDAAGATRAVLFNSSAVGIGVEQRVREELRAVMTELIQSGAFGNQPTQQITLDVDSPAQRVGNLGVLVDSAHAHGDGVHVLAVTPGGTAERMGLRAGDVLVGLNGNALADAGAASGLRRAIDALPDGSTLAFEVQRDGATRTVSGSLTAIYLPAMRLSVGSGVALASAAGAATPVAARESAIAVQGCGRISDFDSAPRQDHLHAATIISIDGVAPGPSGSHAFRVPAGPHAVKVGERIESRYLAFNDRQRNAGVSSDRYKTLTVDVAPDTTTLVAARLNEDHRDDPQGGAYWDPVAWKQTAEACR